MNYITDDRAKISKPLFKKPSAIIIGLVLLMTGTTAYALRQFSTSQSEPAPETVTPKITTVTALGRLEPSGEIIQISAPSSSESNRIEELLVLSLIHI